MACDADISAVNRLHGIVGEFPSPARAQVMTSAELEATIAIYARGARSLGIDVVLSPTADVDAALGTWLDGRILGDDAETVERLVAAFVKGAQGEGITCALKHFPGHPRLMVYLRRNLARVPASLPELRQRMSGFKAGIDAGAGAAVLSSAIFEAFEPPVSANMSPDLIDLLRGDLGFGRSGCDAGS